MHTALRRTAPGLSRRLNLNCSRKMTTVSSRPANWKAAAPSSLPGITFAGQSTLPRLPVPELPDTLAKLKESLKPIAWNESEYAAVEKKIDQFGNALGPELQKRLSARAQSTEHWLEEWWDDIAYLGYRDSVSSLYLRLDLTRMGAIRCHPLSVFFLGWGAGQKRQRRDYRGWKSNFIA